jgi:3'-phosphoadenosine 5'-phosphosulfate sulfotransferase (PAPS reductase)/FAD synthetase
MLHESLAAHGITYVGNINPPYAVVVPLSGGKDSQACLKLALEIYDPWQVLALFCDTKFEHPITYAHVRKVAASAGVDLVEVNAGSVLSICTKYKRLPGGGSRHCTDELKIRPSKFFYGV